MSPLRSRLLAFAVLAACSGSRHDARAAVDEPWGHAWSGAPDGWWMNWDQALHGNAPFGPGTRFELETLGPEGERRSEVLEVESITPTAVGSFSVVLRSSVSGNAFKTLMPPDLLYSPGAHGFITARSEKLLPVTVPAGSFSAGRLWTSEAKESIPYERDEWVVPDLPVRIQIWSRPASAKELYDPPADGTVPVGTTLTRLVRIERR